MGQKCVKYTCNIVIGSSWTGVLVTVFSAVWTVVTNGTWLDVVKATCICHACTGCFAVAVETLRTDLTLSAPAHVVQAVDIRPTRTRRHRTAFRTRCTCSRPRSSHPFVHNFGTNLNARNSWRKLGTLKFVHGRYAICRQIGRQRTLARTTQWFDSIHIPRNHCPISSTVPPQERYAQDQERYALLCKAFLRRWSLFPLGPSYPVELRLLRNDIPVEKKREDLRTVSG